MKSARFGKVLVVVLTLMAMNALAASKKYAPVYVDWNQRHLEENVVLVCDDSSYDGIDLYVPGGEVYASHIEFTKCGADWHVIKQKSRQDHGRDYTGFRLDGGSQCQLEITEPNKPSGTAKKFVVYISDAC